MVKFLNEEKSSLLLRSHQTSQQTNFGRVRDQPGSPASIPALLISEIRMYVSLYVCMYACMYITAFASIPSNRNRGYFLFRAESHGFACEDVESK